MSRAQNPPIVFPTRMKGKCWFSTVSLFTVSRYAIKKVFLHWANRFTDRFRSIRRVLFTFCWSRSSQLFNGPVDSSLSLPSQLANEPLEFELEFLSSSFSSSLCMLFPFLFRALLLFIGFSLSKRSIENIWRFLRLEWKGEFIFLFNSGISGKWKKDLRIL